MRVTKARKGVGFAVASMALIALLLTGCGSISSPSAAGEGGSSASDDSSSKVEPRKLTEEFLGTLCAADPDSSIEEVLATSATRYLDAFQATADLPEGGNRDKQLESWGIKPKDENAVEDAITALEAREEVECSNASNTPGATEQVGVENEDGTLGTADVYTGGDSTVVVNQTNDPMVPALVSNERLMNRDYRGQGLFTNWEEFRGVIQELPNEDWYIAGLNERTPLTGFTWDNTAAFAAAAKAANLDVRVIAVYNISEQEMSDQAVRDAKRPEIGPIADTLNIVRYGNTWNTMKTGTVSNPKMTSFLDGEKMIRVSLAPLVLNADGTVWLNAKGKPEIDTRKGSGIFVDCVNIHWIVKYLSTWECTGDACSPPPAEVCPYNPALPVGSPNCLKPKDPADDVPAPYGVVPLYTLNQLTNGRTTQEQRDRGEVSGNAGTSQVGSNTSTGTTTQDTGTQVGVGGSDPALDTSDDQSTPGNINQDQGTGGDGHISDPDG